MEIFIIIAVPFALALAIMGLRPALKAHQQGWLLAGFFALGFGLLLSRLPLISQQGAISYSLAWMPQIGLNFSLYIDGLALLFGLVVTGIAAVVFFYGGYYFEDGREAGRFFALLLGFTGAMLLLVMAGNLLLLFIAWELTSIISFLLIGFKGKDAEARRGASQALVITGGGGLALLVGLLLAGSATGSLEMPALLASGDALRQSFLYPAIVLLIALGCFSKSAQFPLHFWLPDAMSAPTPASAFLHSATMVKAGIYLLARLYPALGDMPLWTGLLVIIGLATLLFGAAAALRHPDLKGMLAFSTISQLGALVALIGLPAAEGIKAAMVGILGHALYKCALFLVVGAVDHSTGTRLIARLGGLARLMPGFAAVTAVAGLSMAGVPPLLGFVAKETLIEAYIHQPLGVAVVVISATLTVTLALRLFFDVFMGRPAAEPAHADPHQAHADEHHGHGDDHAHFHAPPRLMAAGPGLLATASVVLGLGIAPLVEPLVERAAGKDVSLYLFPPGGVNAVLLLSITALALGAAVFAVRRTWLAWPIPQIISGPEVYRRAVGLLEAAGDLLLRSQGGRIRYYLAAILAAVLLLLWQVTINAAQVNVQATPVVITGVVDVLKILLLVLSLGATLASVLFERHLLAALSLGIAGYAIGGLFLLEPAPDVALVQFLVETLATVLIIIILGRASDAERRKAMSRLWAQTGRGLLRDVTISAGLGAAVMVFALAAVSSRPTPNPIATWHLQNALPELGVNDVVAGIITDFRGTDTLIEITVFSMAALGILTLLARPNPGKKMQLFRRNRVQVIEAVAIGEEAIQEDAQRPEPLIYRSHFNDPITRVAAVPVLPIAMAIAAAHLLYAGAAPGDGFTAGVICGLGVTLWYVVFGYEEASQRLHWLNSGLLIGCGLLLAFGNALLPLLGGGPFLEHLSVEGFTFAGIKVASSLVFEIGICLTVFGGTSAILEAITHPKEVEPL